MSNRIVYFDLDKGTAINGDLAPAYNEDAVKESVINLLLTEPSTLIYGNRSMGCSLQKFLFAPIDTSTAIDILEEVELAINRYETRAKNLIVTVIPIPDDNTFQINVTFNVDQADREVVIDELLYRLR